MSAGRSVAGEIIPATDGVLFGLTGFLGPKRSARSQRRRLSSSDCGGKALQAQNFRAADALPPQRQAAGYWTPDCPQATREARPARRAENKWLGMEGKRGADYSALH